MPPVPGEEYRGQTGLTARHAGTGQLICLYEFCFTKKVPPFTFG